MESIYNFRLLPSVNVMYKAKIIEDEFNERESFNSTEQTSNIAVSKKDLWRLLVTWVNGKPECACE